MPQLGESVEEGTISRWLKSPGEIVEEFEALLEINTDKVDTEIPSPASGVLLVTLAEEGQVVTVGTVLAWIGQEGEEIPAWPDAGQSQPPLPKTTEPEPALEYPQGSPPLPVTGTTRTIHPGRDPEIGFISPIVARIASENNLDLRSITGTGQHGRITKNDLLGYLGASKPASQAPPKITPGISAPAPEPARAGQILPLTPVRRAIADHMVMSKHTSPHVTTVMEVDLSRVTAHRSANKGAFARDNIKLTFTPYFISAIVTALKAYPIVNSSWDEKGIILHQGINIGMATSLGEEGLIVPVIKNAERLSLTGLARLVNDLAARARSKQLQPDEVKGGTFTITNHGISGSLFATPIINQPQCGILGVGAIQKRVVVVSDTNGGDSIAIRPMAYLTLTFDHRILDGAIADYFLAKIITVLQEWS
jgi:2-oxoglutarate dehydrogenase E2 component (dihydrolipoamide succinyltransferase)